MPNEMIKTEIETIKGSIVATLRPRLHHKGIELSLRVAEPMERQKILTRREQLEQLNRDYPGIERLCKELDLILT